MLAGSVNSVALAKVARSLPEYALGHAIVHNPMDECSARFLLTQGLAQAQERKKEQARCIADLLLGLDARLDAGDEPNGWWAATASNLLAACLLRFSTLGEIYQALQNVEDTARQLDEKNDEARHLSIPFRFFVERGDPQAMALAVIILLNLSGWADAKVRRQTCATDFNAWDSRWDEGNIMIFTCPPEMEHVFGNYLVACQWWFQTRLHQRGRRNCVVRAIL